MKTLQKQLPERFTSAVTKLYNAFHNDELNTMDCERCAVGNICNNRSDWRYIPEYNMERHAGDFKPYVVISETGYSINELLNIESLFMYNTKKNELFNNEWRINKDSKEHQFEGLCKVVEYLCELDNIPNVMDYTSLFEYENQIKELTF